MILVVDDHRDTRIALVRILNMEGYEATDASCGSEALVYLRHRTPSLVILDYNMPDMDGFAVFEAMKQEPRTSAIPVILFTASNGRIREQASEIGIDAYVPKGSLDWSGLHREIVRLIGQGMPRQQPPEVRRGTRDAG